MTSARGHGAIVYCLNSGTETARRVAIINLRVRRPLTIGEAYLKKIMSSFLVLCEGDTKNRGEEKRSEEEDEKSRENRRKEKGEGDGKGEGKESLGRESGARLVWRRELSPGLEWKDGERRWR
ncbi:hypothetical protein TNCV_1446011 [Trichonephila clavipes]|nr:hypothetical protein TNCV_1446011 [Trichonephila clavipes]